MFVPSLTPTRSRVYDVVADSGVTFSREMSLVEARWARDMWASIGVHVIVMPVNLEYDGATLI